MTAVSNSKLQDDINNIPLADDDPQGKNHKNERIFIINYYKHAAIIHDESELPSLSDGNASSMIHGRSMDSIQSTFTNGSSSPQHISLGHHSLETDANIDEQEEKARLISQVLELQNTLDGLIKKRMHSNENLS